MKERKLSDVRCAFAAPDCLDFVEGEYYDINKLLNMPHTIDGDYLVLSAVWINAFSFTECARTIAMFEIAKFRA